MQSSPGFYLGYLRGRSFPPPKKKKCPASPQKVLFHIFTVYSISNYSISEKSSRLDEVSAHGTVPFLIIVSQNAPDCFSAHIHFKKCPRGTPPTPLGRSGPRPLLPEMINPR